MITVHRIKDADGSTQGITVVIDTDRDLKSFVELVQRATNLWPDATPAIKEFADEITNGKVFQDYSKQDTSPKKECKHLWVARHVDDSTRLEFICKHCNVRAGEALRATLINSM